MPLGQNRETDSRTTPLTFASFDGGGSHFVGGTPGHPRPTSRADPPLGPGLQGHGPKNRFFALFSLNRRDENRCHFRCGTKFKNRIDEKFPHILEYLSPKRHRLGSCYDGATLRNVDFLSIFSQFREKGLRKTAISHERLDAAGRCLCCG